MARTTFKLAIVEVLDDLNEEDYLRFCDQLRDRREKPRVSRNNVEGKRRWEVAGVLVSTFTGCKAVQVTLDLLRQLNLNEEAEELAEALTGGSESCAVPLSATGCSTGRPSGDEAKRGGGCSKDSKSL
uniref:Pyrin domain-containing protein n=1 Tax=Labrus bergylta TaxID=56723 RepID=A0A3Q3MNM4_9LABR